MASRAQRKVGPYLWRLAFYVVPVAASSVLGALYARSTGNWPDAGVGGGLAAVPFSIGPALLIVSSVRLGTRVAAAVAAVASATMLAMWIIFAHRTSDTAILAFLWAPLIGIPVAALFTVAMRQRQALELRARHEFAGLATKSCHASDDDLRSNLVTHLRRERLR
ncbi:MAG: hypothetical protein R2706_00570 [Acidimicrobiales bacterium]